MTHTSIHTPLWCSVCKLCQGYLMTSLTKEADNSEYSNIHGCTSRDHAIEFK